MMTGVCPSPTGHLIVKDYMKNRFRNNKFPLQLSDLDYFIIVGKD